MIGKIWNKSNLNGDKIWKVWKKNKLNSEKIWNIWKKSQLSNEMIWKIKEIKITNLRFASLFVEKCR
jgi:hypothetical protein